HHVSNVRQKVAASLFGKAQFLKAESRNRRQSRFIKSGMGKTPYGGRAATRLIFQTMKTHCRFEFWFVQTVVVFNGILHPCLRGDCHPNRFFLASKRYECSA
ncbi:MAG TPA: hypothetical protein VF430_05675, partial [Verrucomicrobiae bacterium]